MNFRSLLLASVIVAGAALAGCGSDPCQKLADDVAAKAKECNLTSMVDSTTPGKSVACEDKVAILAECESGCVNAATCEALSGEDETAATNYVNCLTSCNEGGP